MFFPHAATPRAPRAPGSFGRAAGRKISALVLGLATVAFAAEPERYESLAALTESWIAPHDLVTALDLVPVTGETAPSPWTADYWPMQRGGPSYRYASLIAYKTGTEAAGAYQQPDEWKALTGELTPARTLGWSPTEKYDLAVGDESFALTRAVKQSIVSREKWSGPVAWWEGYGGGWSASAVAAAEPARPVTLVGAKGARVTFYPADVEALLALAWGQPIYAVTHTGSPCNRKSPETYPNGRVKAPECFDVNPAIFHLALANLVGKAKLAVIADTEWGQPIFNDPIRSYALEYFNPLSPDKKSRDWSDVAVAYDESFKRQDRFQTPLTRGKRVGEKYDDSKVRRIVGVSARVGYQAVASPPPHSPEPPPSREAPVQYRYDLELAQEDGRWVPTGGEWLAPEHPDLLWLPRKGAYPRRSDDTTDLKFTGESVPPPATATAAAKASARDLYPLCQVLRTLVERSSGAPYPCAKVGE